MTTPTMNEPTKERAAALTVEQARGIAARCWCEPETSHIEMIPELAEAFARALLAAPVSERAPDRGYAAGHCDGWNECLEQHTSQSSTDSTPLSPDGRVADKAMVKRLAIQHGLIPSSGGEAKAGERDELMRLLTEYEGALADSEGDESAIEPARTALMDFLRPIRQELDARASAQQSDAAAAKPIYQARVKNGLADQTWADISGDVVTAYAASPHYELRIVYTHPAAVPVAEDARDAAVNALRELVSLKDLKDRLQRLHEMGHGTDYDRYHKAKPLAWEAARKAIAALAADQSARKGE